MRKSILSLLLLATSILGAQAQTAENLDSKYAKDFLPVGMQAPDFTLKKAKEDQPALIPTKKAQSTVLDATYCSTSGRHGVVTAARKSLP